MCIYVSVRACRGQRSRKGSMKRMGRGFIGEEVGGEWVMYDLRVGIFGVKVKSGGREGETH